MSDTLPTRAPRHAVPLVLLRAGGDFEAWLKKQNAAVRNWLDLQQYKATAGSFCLLPDSQGGLSQVVVGLSDPISKWDLAALPLGLPVGTYALQAQGLQDADLEKLVFGWLMGGYRVRADQKPAKKSAALYLDPADRKRIALKRLEALAEAMIMARDLINLPAEELGPAELAAAITDVAKTYGAKITQCVGDALLKKGFPAIHAIGRAAARPPRFVELTWGKPKDPCVVLTGKGVCFDTGGLNLKTGSGMTLMRKDMGGAACALAVARLVMANKLPVYLRLLVPIVENAIGGNAIRPSDVIQMRCGLRVQIGNTDAEGRMVLADALTEAQDSKAPKPALLVDFSTLGPAAAIFGPYMGMFFTHDDKLAALLADVAPATEDMLWRMPFYPPYAKMVDGGAVADLINSPSSSNGFGVIAAHFLDRFVARDIPWIHLDFMAWNMSSRPGRPEGAEAMSVTALYTAIEKLFAK